MGFHRPARGAPAAACESFDDGVVLLQRRGGFAGERHDKVAAAVERSLGHLDRMPEARQFGDLADCMVEGIIEAEGFGKAAPVDRGLMQHEEVFQRIAGSRRHAGCGLSDAFGFERTADQKGFADLAAVDLAYERPGLGSNVDEPLMAEPHDRLVHRRARDAQLGRDRLLVDHLARLQPSGQDERTQDEVNLLAHGCCANETDVRKIERIIDDCCP